MGDVKYVVFVGHPGDPPRLGEPAALRAVGLIKGEGNSKNTLEVSGNPVTIRQARPQRSVRLADSLSHTQAQHEEAMKFTGRELKELGVPQDRIKYFVGKEYDSPEALLRAVAEFRVTPPKSEEVKEIDRIIREDPDCAFQVLWELQVYPWSPQANSTSPSKREVRQWLDDKAVRINGKFPKAHEHVEFPITDLVYFPGAKRQTTIV